MIISSQILRKEFERLLSDVNVAISEEAIKNENYFLSRNAQKLEIDVFKFFETLAKGTSFENKIKLVSGHKFPDIVAHINEVDAYGVEVKTTKKNEYKCIGNSILESTRVEGIDRVYLFFGKLHKPIGFKHRLYQECLPEVSVTHSPRYQIDMELGFGKSIFDKIGITYDQLRVSENPIEPIVNYYKDQLKEGESLWWISDSENSEPSINIKTRLFSSLEYEEKNRLKYQATCLFPEILYEKGKYGRAALWLLHKGITDSSLRDRFSAGGKVNISIGSNIFTNLPQKVADIFLNSKRIAETLSKTDKSLLAEHWGQETQSDPVYQWLNIVDKIIGTIPAFSNKSFSDIFIESLEKPCKEIKK